MMKRFTRYQRLEGEMMPRGYRTAWYNYDFQWDVCYPIGIHLIARLIHRVWEWTYLYRPSKLELLLVQAASDARRDERTIWESRMQRAIERERESRVLLEQRFEELMELTVRQQMLTQAPIIIDRVTAESVKDKLWPSPSPTPTSATSVD